MFDWAKKIAETVVPAGKTTRDILNEANAAISSNRGQLRETHIKELLGNNFIGAEDYKSFLGVEDVGAVPPIPLSVTEELLNSRCPITKDGRLIKDTHILAFVPVELDGKPFTITDLRARLEERYPDGKIFDANYTLHKDQPFSNTPLSEGRYVLMPKFLPQETFGKTYQGQEEALKGYPDYHTARALEITAPLVMNCLKNGERCFSDVRGWCEDVTGSGLRAYVGLFFAAGLYVDCVHTAYHVSFLGRAVLRNV